MQQHDGAFGCGVQRRQHAVKVDAAQATVGALVEVGVGFHHKTGVGEQGAVVFPAGIGNQNLGRRADLLQEVSANFQAAGAANALHGGHAATFHHI